MGECRACTIGKFVRSPRESVAIEKRAGPAPLDFVNFDMVGLLKHLFLERSKYFVA